VLPRQIFGARDLAQRNHLNESVVVLLANGEDPGGFH
jgi:hypothetical protein